MNNGRLILFGRFPPPIDGQSLATRRFASLVEKDFAITSINSNTDSSSNVFAKFRHYMSIGRELRLTTKEDPNALIVWQSISPQISGHFRDILAVVPYVRKHPTLAVVHWGSFSRLFQSPVTRLTAALMGKMIERFVFTTDSLSNACDEWIPAGKRAVIPNTIDVDTVCTEREVGEKRDRVSSDPLRVLFLSNMIREKGYLPERPDRVRRYRLKGESGGHRRAPRTRF
jgi:hypothetical protein